MDGSRIGFGDKVMCHRLGSVLRGTAAATAAGVPVAALLLAMTASPGYSQVGACPIAADFGAQPEIVLQDETSMAGQIVTATVKRAFVDGGMIAIECTNLSVDDAFPGMTDEQILANYIKFFEVSPLDNGRGGLDWFSEPVPHASITGTKTISGTIVVYSYRLFRFNDSSAMVIVAFPAASQDRRGIVRFLESLSID